MFMNFLSRMEENSNESENFLYIILIGPIMKWSNSLVVDYFVYTCQITIFMQQSFFNITIFREKNF